MKQILDTTKTSIHVRIESPVFSAPHCRLRSQRICKCSCWRHGSLHPEVDIGTMLRRRNADAKISGAGVPALAPKKTKFRSSIFLGRTQSQAHSNTLPNAPAMSGQDAKASPASTTDTSYKPPQPPKPQRPPNPIWRMMGTHRDFLRTGVGRLTDSQACPISA